MSVRPTIPIIAALAAAFASTMAAIGPALTHPVAIAAAAAPSDSASFV